MRVVNYICSYVDKCLGEIISIAKCQKWHNMLGGDLLFALKGIYPHPLHH